jgi:hypothetical protein
MKKIILAISLFTTLKSYSQEDYTIQLGDTSFSAALDKSYNISVNGKLIEIKISQKDTLTFVDELYTFKYLKGFKVSKSKIDEGISQLVLLSAEGTGLIIQQYENLNPTNLIEFMLTELTKESISYGFESKRSTHELTLKNGKKTTVTKAVLTYKDEINTYEIAALGNKDSGIIITTMKMDNTENSQGQKLINLMWQSLLPTW